MCSGDSARGRARAVCFSAALRAVLCAESFVAFIFNIYIKYSSRPRDKSGGLVQAWVGQKETFRAVTAMYHQDLVARTFRGSVNCSSAQGYCINALGRLPGKVILSQRGWPSPEVRLLGRIYGTVVHVAPLGKAPHLWVVSLSSPAPSADAAAINDNQPRPRAPVCKPPGHGTWIQRMSDWTS